MFFNENIFFFSPKIKRALNKHGKQAPLLQVAVDLQKFIRVAQLELSFVRPPDALLLILSQLHAVWQLQENIMTRFQCGHKYLVMTLCNKCSENLLRSCYDVIAGCQKSSACLCPPCIISAWREQWNKPSQWLCACSRKKDPPFCIVQ